MKYETDYSIENMVLPSHRGIKKWGIILVEFLSTDHVRITGVQFNYYFVCKRKLWLFSHHIGMEHTSEAVEMGRILHEHAYSRKQKEIELDGIKIDFYDKNRGIINEVKKSKAVEESHIWQLKYYLYYFRKLGIDVKGQINYPLLKRREIIELEPYDVERVEAIMAEIVAINQSEKPPAVTNQKICKKCSYDEFCYV